MPIQGTPDKTTFEKILSGLSKSGSLGRKAISQAVFDLGSSPTTMDILKGRDDYSPREFINDIGKKHGLDLEFGGKKKSGMDKILNFGVELATDVMTDPLTLLGTGVAKMAAPIASSLKLGKAGTAALKGAMVGGVLGATTGDDATESVINGAIGAATLGVGSKLLTYGGKQFLTKVGDPAVDWAMKKLNPEVFENARVGYSEAYKTVKGTIADQLNISRHIRETDNMLGFSSLGPEEARELGSVLDGAYSTTATRRNLLEKGFYQDKLKFKDIDGLTVHGTQVDPKTMGELVSFQELRKTGQTIGDRNLIARDGDEFVRLTAAGGDNNFVLNGRSKKMNELFPAKSKNYAVVDSIEKFNDLDTIKYGMRNGNGDLLHELGKKDLNALTRKSNTYIGKLLDEQLAKTGDSKLTENVWKWRDRNRKMVGDYNKTMRERLGDAHIDMEPIDFHTHEVKLKEDFVGKGVNFDNITEGFIKRSSDAPIETAGLTFQERMALEAEGFHKNYLTKQQKEAVRIVDGVRYHKSGDKFVKTGKPLDKAVKAQKVKEVSGDQAFKNVVEKYDTFTQFLKQQHLTFSHSWVVNNFTDNLLKSYMTGGTSNAWKTLINQGKAGMRIGSDDLVSDLLKLTDPNGLAKKGIPFKSDLVDIAVEHGAISEGFFKEAFDKGQISKAMLQVKVGTDEAAKIMAEAANVSGLAKMNGQYKDFLGATVGRTGSLLENAARATTFKHHVRTILDSNEMLNSLGISMDKTRVGNIIRKHGYSGAKKELPALANVYDEAGRVASDTFFDYNNISAFEDKVMKRIFPYWTYFSKNLKQWPELIAKHPERFSNVTKVYRATGKAPTERERLGLPEYMLNKGARMSEGNAVTVPNVSFHDALSFATEIPFTGKNTAEKIHPLFKAMYQLAFKKDDFGGELYPSNTRSGQKRAFGSALKYAPLTDSVYRDRATGKMYTDSDMLQFGQTLQKNLLPVPAIDTLAKVINKMSKGDSALDTLVNLGPVQTNNLSRADKAKTARYRMRNAQVKHLNEVKRKVNKQ